MGYLEIATTTCIFNSSLSSLYNLTLDVSKNATPGRFRFVDSGELINANRLCIYELDDIPSDQYVATSYVWRGLPAKLETNSSFGFFHVKGAEDGDPMSFDVLLEVGRIADKEGLQYIWIDRLCILQTSRDDKNWQIMHMFDIYRLCHVCVILPGGLARLADIDEKTARIDRGWTLQEAITPTRTVVLFAWGHGGGVFEEPYDDDKPDISVIEVTVGKSAVLTLLDTLTLCDPDPIAVDFRGDEAAQDGFRCRSPAVALFAPGPACALRQAMVGQARERKESAIWRCAMMRVSSRPVDMVFSIMGLFGVTLNPGSFHKEDRLHATIALMQGILRSGGTASWIAASVSAPICRQLSTVAEFLQPDDTFFQETSEDFADMTYANHLKGDMDDNGYFHFSAKAVRITLKKDAEWKDFEGASSSPLKDSDGSLIVIIRSQVWSLGQPQHPDSGHRVFAVYVGTDSEILEDTEPDEHMVFMAVEEHTPGKFHRGLGFGLKMESGWKEVVDGWDECAFSVGGPEKVGPPVDPKARVVEPDPERAAHLQDLLPFRFYWPPSEDYDARRQIESQPELSSSPSIGPGPQVGQVVSEEKFAHIEDQPAIPATHQNPDADSSVRSWVKFCTCQ